jgi:hypothetical protein
MPGRAGVTNRVIRYASPDLALRANWPAFVSLVCGALLIPVYVAGPNRFSSFRGYTSREGLMLVALWITCGWVACALGIVGFRRANRLKVGGRKLAGIAILLGAMNVVAVPWLNRFETQRSIYRYGVDHAWVRCSSNLRKIGVAILLYSNDHDGHFPSRLQDLLVTEDITTDDFVCPFSADTAATGPTTQARVANVALGGHLSYVYVGQQLTNSAATADTIVVYEKPGNHSSERLDLFILYGDGHVAKVSEQELRRIITEVEAGHNPPHDPTRGKAEPEELKVTRKN